MAIRFFNSRTKATDRFEPLESGKVTMYTCGPTVYDFAHIGNFRTFLASDVVRRYLEAEGHDVHHVMNITDVGHMVDDTAVDGGGQDKMATAGLRIKEAKKSGRLDAGTIENPDDPYQVADYYASAFIEDGQRLGLGVCFEGPGNLPRATQHVDGMIRLIERLIEREHAYVGPDGVVYFSVESFPDYGTLSGNTLDQLREGEGGRVIAEDQAAKRHPADFLLWKADPTHIMKWDSPWGTGYPGWHLECSVMAMGVLGRETIDIHTGGEDLIFPHHECECAQSCGATGKALFARHWMHARFLLVEGEKMSKSSGTFHTVRDVLSGAATEGKPVAPEVLRYELTKSHYRANSNFTVRGLKDSAGAVRKLADFRKRMEELLGGSGGGSDGGGAAGNSHPKAAKVDRSHPMVADFLDALADDLNMSGALGAVFPWMAGDHPDPAESLGAFNIVNHVLNVAPLCDPTGAAVSFCQNADAESARTQADAWCRELDEARACKDYAAADAVRARLQDAGWTVQTGPDGSVATGELGS